MPPVFSPLDFAEAAIDNAPNHALQRTAPGVTAPAPRRAHHAGAAPPSAVSELEVVRRFCTRTMKNPQDPDWDEFKDPEIVDWKRVRSAIEHENDLTNHRFTWLLASQGFLFAAFALTWQASTKTDIRDADRASYQVLLAAFAVTGILVSLYLSRGMVAAHNQHNALESWWRQRPKTDANRHPPLCGTDPRMFRNMPYYRIPYIFASAWVLLTLTVLANYIKPYTSHITIAIFALVPAILIFFLGRASAIRGTK